MNLEGLESLFAYKTLENLSHTVIDLFTTSEDFYMIQFTLSFTRFYTFLFQVLFLVVLNSQ